MSSHHVVRDGQEPALLITSSYFNTDVLFQLLEWSPVVIVFKQALQRVLDLDVKIDVVFCNAREEDEVQKLVSHQSHLIINICEQDEMQMVYSFMKSKNYTALNIIGNNDVVKNNWELAEQNSNSVKSVYFTYKQKAKHGFCNTKSYLLTSANNSKWMSENILFCVKSYAKEDFSIDGNYVNTNEADIYKTTGNGFIAVYGISSLLVFAEIF